MKIEAPKAAKASAVARPMAPAPPVTKTTRPCSAGALAVPSFASSSGQYSMSNRSASEIERKPPATRPSAFTRADWLPISAAIRAALASAPAPTAPMPSSQISPGIGVSIATGPPKRALLASK